MGHYSQEPNYGNSPDALQLMNGLRKCGIYGRILFDHKEE
jgi:hypothetical protein